ncbi:ABC1 kinase family protein [Aquibacillus rhizosphaerae]|uniref:AarF/UbiB family protein n=1 Tax=Aquibacillus rhizosphaerae TaxID=3051431 RepID=A0ABT7L8U6_9BACI|nr:AarF/UbiB family protein [Aquibacillus sp. LR5S19]MDL4842295.1 AarF/UbiB family protein [Aquibacillus sp. LR5S19]
MKYNGIYRMSAIVMMTVKFLLQIYFFHFFHRVWDWKTKKKWENLLEKQAKQYRMKAVELGGLLIKFGQFLSVRGDLLPEVFIKQLQGLTDSVKPIPFHYSKRILEEEWGGSLGDHVSELDENPIASASIGEVYRAILPNGKKVAVKVQRYRVEEVFKMDFRALRLVFWLISNFTVYGKRANLRALYQEIVFVMGKELDFVEEHKRAKYFKKRFAAFDNVHVPIYYEDLSSSRVLVMEWIDGTKVDDFAFMRNYQIDRKNVAKTLFDLYIDQFINPGLFHADPHVGNIILGKDGSLSIIDFGMVGEIKKEDSNHLRNIVQGFILDDYDRVIKSLIEMEFILKHADTEKIATVLRKTFRIYKEDTSRMHIEMMNQIMEDIQLFVKEQPIQLPANYAFLGRAVSIIFGVLTTIYPEIDVDEWGRPIVKKWASGEGGKGSIYTEILKESAQPLLSLPQELVGWLNDGEKDREWEKNKQRYKFMHHFFIFYASISFILTIMGFTVFTVGLLLDLDLLFNIGSVSSLFFLILFLVLILKHVKMIRSLKFNRRFW